MPVQPVPVLHPLRFVPDVIMALAMALYHLRCGGIEGRGHEHLVELRYCPLWRLEGLALATGTAQAKGSIGRVRKGSPKRAGKRRALQLALGVPSF